MADLGLLIFCATPLGLIICITICICNYQNNKYGKEEKEKESEEE